MQDKHGDKVGVLLLSVDLEYGGQRDQAMKDDKERMSEKGVAFDNVLLPKGFEDAQRIFNLDGYGLTLVGPDGIVRAIDTQGESVGEEVDKWLSEAGAQKTGA